MFFCRSIAKTERLNFITFSSKCPARATLLKAEVCARCSKNSHAADIYHICTFRLGVDLKVISLLVGLVCGTGRRHGLWHRTLHRRRVCLLGCRQRAEWYFQKKLCRNARCGVFRKHTGFRARRHGCNEAELRAARKANRV